MATERALTWAAVVCLGQSGSLAAAPLLAGSGLAGLSSGNRQCQRCRDRGKRAAEAWLAGGLQRRPRRPEHEPHLSNDDPHPAGDDQHHPDGLRPWRHLLRRGRGLRPARGGTDPRRRRGAVPRQGRDHVEVRLEHRSRDRRAAPGAQQPPGPHQAGRRGHAQAPAHRSHRSPLPAPRRPAGADRGCRRRGQGPDGRRQGPALGPVRDGAEHAAPRSCRAARHAPFRTNIRCYGAGRKSR